MTLSQAMGVSVMQAEYKGLDTVSPLDGTNSGNGTTTAISTNSITTANVCDLLVSANYTDGSATQTGPGFWNRLNLWGNFIQDRVVSTTGTYSASATQQAADAYVSGLIALKKTLGTQALPAIRNVQWNGSPYDSAATQFSVPFMSAQTAGNLNIVVVSWESASGNVASVIDSAGNSYVLAGSVVRGTGLSQADYYAKNIASYAGGNSVTVNFDTNQIGVLEILEYRGLSTTNPLDQSASATGSLTTRTSPSVTTTSANELILGVTKTANGTTWVNTVGSGFVVRAMDVRTPNTHVQDKVVSSTGTYSVTSTSDVSMNWITQILTFR